MARTDTACLTCTAARDAFAGDDSDVQPPGWVGVAAGAVADPAEWAKTLRVYRCPGCHGLFRAFFDPYNCYWDVTPLPEGVARLLGRRPRTSDVWPLIDQSSHEVRGLVHAWLSVGDVDIGEIANGLVARLREARSPDRVHEILVYLRMALVGESGGKIFQSVKAGGRPVPIRDPQALTSLLDRTELWRGRDASAGVERAVRDELAEIVRFGLGGGPESLVARLEVPDEDRRRLAAISVPATRVLEALRGIDAATRHVEREAVPVGGEPVPEGREAWGLPVDDVAALRAGLDEIVARLGAREHELSADDGRVLIAATVRLEALARQSDAPFDTARVLAKRYRTELEMLARHTRVAPDVRGALAEFLGLARDPLDQGR